MYTLYVYVCVCVYVNVYTHIRVHVCMCPYALVVFKVLKNLPNSRDQDESLLVPPVWCIFPPLLPPSGQVELKWRLAGTEAQDGVSDPRSWARSGACCPAPHCPPAAADPRVPSQRSRRNMAKSGSLLTLFPCPGPPRRPASSRVSLRLPYRA